MRIPAATIMGILFLGLLIQLGWERASAQAQSPPGSNHVVIPNPTPRPPDLKREYDDSAKDQGKQKEQLIELQLRAREIWLESNQLLLLAQQLDQETHSAGKAPPMSAEAAKVAKIQKLAQSIQDKMKAH